MTSICDRIAEWTFDAALPFWAEEGPDQKFGGFVEELEFNGQDAARPYKRVRVTCRQIYVFSHAKLLGWDDGTQFIAHGADYLTRKAWRGRDNGFARRMTREGEVLDPTPDLYEQAFALFAFAWAYRATGDSAYREWAHQTLDFIEDKLTHPGGEGFWHELPGAAPRQQNPHMHLLEASIAAYEATGETRFRDVAVGVATLFKRRFFHRASGTLTEFFADDWTPFPGEAGEIVEPGHQLEWAWILTQCQRLFALEFEKEIGSLINYAERCGLNADGAVMNAIRRDGTPIKAGSRSWPNTERLKAGVALLDTELGAPTPLIDGAVGLLFDRYLSPREGFNIPRGGWIDAFDANGAPTATAMPASTLYHLFLAFAEILRVRDKLSAAAEGTASGSAA